MAGPLAGYKARVVISGLTFRAKEVTWRETRKEEMITDFENSGDVGYETGLRVAKRLEVKVTQATLDDTHNLFLAPVDLATEEDRKSVV